MRIWIIWIYALRLCADVSLVSAIFYIPHSNEVPTKGQLLRCRKILILMYLSVHSGQNFPAALYLTFCRDFNK